MSSRPWQQRIADIIEAIQEIETLTQTSTAIDLEQDSLRYKAILYNQDLRKGRGDGSFWECKNLPNRITASTY